MVVLRKGCLRKVLVGGKDVVSDENFVNLAYKNFVSFNECLGFPKEGFEKEVDSLLRKLEALEL